MHVNSIVTVRVSTSLVPYDVTRDAMLRKTRQAVCPYGDPGALQSHGQDEGNIAVREAVIPCVLLVLVVVLVARYVEGMNAMVKVRNM